MARTKPIAPPSAPIAGGLGTTRMPAPVAPRSPDATPSRFQSFVERFVIERCGYWPRQGDEGMISAAWDEILFARTVYNMIGGIDENARKKARGKV